MRQQTTTQTGERRAAREREAVRSAAPAKRAGSGSHGGIRRLVGALAASAVFALVGTIALAPLDAPATSPSGFADASPASTAHDNVQRVNIAANTLRPAVSRESYTASTGPETLVQGGTNHDWAKLVLVEGGFPVTDANVAVITQWMREENGPDNWWNRNNPLNNGNGSGGGSGLGSYATLQVGAYYAADSLRRLSFYDAIESALDAGTDAAATASAIWSSPWATSHYGNGSHWTTSPVPVVEAPASAWGR